jgi:hypothetical protein
MEREPYFTNEERKMSWIRDEDYHKFITRVDLSGGIDVYPDSYTPIDKPSSLAQDVASFIANFMIFYYPRLNGFSGMDCIEWRIHEKPYDGK